MTAVISTQPRCKSTPGATTPRLALKVWPAVVTTSTLLGSTSMTSASVRLMPGLGEAVKFSSRTATT